MAKLTREYFDELLAIYEKGGLSRDVFITKLCESSFSIKTPHRRTTPPELGDVEQFFDQNGYTKEHAQKVYNYYNDADWRDAAGKPVLSWKQKMRGNWMREEGKKPLRQTLDYSTLTIDQAQEYKNKYGQPFLIKLESKRQDLFVQLISL